MRLLSLRLLVAVAGLAVSPAAAITYQFSTPISGDVVPVTVSLEDVPGGVDLTVSIAPGSGDLLGLFGSVTPESLVSQLSFANPTGVVTQWQFQANAVWKVVGGNARVAFLRIDGSFLGELPLEEPRGIEAVSAYGFVVGSPSAGLWAALPRERSARAIPCFARGRRTGRRRHR